MGISEHGVASYRNREMPPRWLAAVGIGGEAEIEVEPSGPISIEEERERRRTHTPRRPEGGAVVGPPLDYGVIAGYIEGAYTLAGHTVGGSDPALGAAVEGHAAAAGRAWAAWIRSEPKVAALLQRMMVGTPLGEVIGVHVSIAFAYFLARGEAQRLARVHAGGAEPGEPDGSAEPAEDPLAAATG